jgi:hypothetical protein
MEQSQINEGTMIIAEFMDGGHFYHSSWDWLMPVVKKFDYLVENKVINNSKDYEFWCDKIDDTVTRTYEIMPVFKIMVEAIEWYNSLKNK